MVQIDDFIRRYAHLFHQYLDLQPWEVTESLATIINSMVAQVQGEYHLTCEGIAIHKTAVVENGVTLKGPLLIGENCVVCANAYLRGPVFLDQQVKIGPGAEIKQSIIFEHTAIAHLNYVGDSIIGSYVNFEAGSVAANHYNERDEKEISVLLNDEVIKTGCNKFGALVGDYARIGANAVLSPGTLLQKYAVVGRLQLVEQIKNTAS
ncbi:MAG: hypothetical protein IT257_04985 [Chitinophagaceae bacterium]|nr:hypothetical protein [Chitinophagaceae bacterium]